MLNMCVTGCSTVTWQLGTRHHANKYSARAPPVSQSSILNAPRFTPALAALHGFDGYSSSVWLLPGKA